MNADGNSVNIEKRAYHHGDLRAALIAEGLRLLAERDAESLSLREMARNAGVSATSVYRHFPDKEALMGALAREGLEKLAETQKAAAAGLEGLAAFSATGRAYVRFALANPALFRLIFASPALGDAKRPSGESEAWTFLRQYNDAAALYLRRNAAAAENASIEDRATSLRAVRAWSLVHGLAMLMLDGQVPVDDALIDAVIADV